MAQTERLPHMRAQPPGQRLVSWRCLGGGWLEDQLLAFAAFLLSFGYVTVEIIHANERRLLAIEDELKVAWELQVSILPPAVPEVGSLRIAATYLPMTD